MGARRKRLQHPEDGQPGCLKSPKPPPTGFAARQKAAAIPTEPPSSPAKDRKPGRPNHTTGTQRGNQAYFSELLARTILLKTQGERLRCSESRRWFVMES